MESHLHVLKHRTLIDTLAFNLPGGPIGGPFFIHGGMQPFGGFGQLFGGLKVGGSS
jgi:hypothetical protein